MKCVLKGLCVNLVIIGFMFTGGAHAASSDAIKKQFLNYKFAEKFWTEKNTREDLTREWLFVKDIYKIWRYHYDVDKVNALKILKRDPSGPTIARAHDIFLLYSQWHRGYRSYNAEYAWNNGGGKAACEAMSAQNAFTGSCLDYPDWRSPIERKRDDEKKSLGN